MYLSQRVLRTRDPDRAWSSVSEVLSAARPLGLFLAEGGSETSANGAWVRVFVDYNPQVPVAAAARVQVTQHDGGIFLVLVGAEDQATFLDLLALADATLDAYSIAELAEGARDAQAVERLGESLVGMGFDLAGYEGLCRALESADASCRAQAASAACALGWRSMLRPLHRALAREAAPGRARDAIEAACAELDPPAGNLAAPLPRDSTLDDAIRIARDVFKLPECPPTATVFRPIPEAYLVASEPGVDDRGTLQGRLIIGANELGASVVVSHAPEYGPLIAPLLARLRPASLEELVTESLALRPEALQRRVVADHRYTRELDDLLLQALRDDRPAVRSDALVAIQVANWASALPDLIARRGAETDPRLAELLESCLQQMH